MTVPIYILAGGQSRRFGSDKARAILDGQPLIQRLARQLTPVATHLTVVADVAGKYTDLGLTTIADEQPGLGPLGGLATALTHLPADDGEWLLLVACDLVIARPAWVARLHAAVRHDAQAVAYHDGRRFEPLLALYRRELLPLVRRQLDARELAMQALLLRTSTIHLPLPNDWSTTSQINTPDDHRLAADATDR